MSRTLSLVVAVLVGALAVEGQEPRRVVGWRTDTTGNYPDATPPLRWGPDVNVAWKTPMPSGSDATPVVVGEKVFTVSEPNELICVGKSDGRILWSRSNDVSTLCDLQTLAKDAEARKAGLLKESEALQLELDAVSNTLAKVWDIEVPVGDVGADDKEDTKKREAEEKALKKRVAEISGRLEALRKTAAGLGPVKSKGALKEVGYTCATPVSDGSVLFALFGSGLGVLYDLDGNMQWAKFIRPVLMGYGQSMSPALAGDVLGVHIDEEFFGLDLKTGKILWQARETQHQGSPVAVPAGDTWVFLGTDGSVWRAKDGTVVTKLGFPALNTFNTPVVRGNTATWIGEGKFLCTAAFEGKTGNVTVKHSFKNVPGGTYYASCVLFDGLAALWNNADYKLKNKTLNIADAASGKKLAETNLTVGGWAYASPTVAGGFLFVSGDKGETAVLLAKRSGGDFVLKEVARNSLEKFRCCPVFEKDRMYVRGLDNLWCIKRSDADKALAEELLGNGKK